MCGLTGFLGRSAAYVPAELAARMAQTLAHRGPDDDGIWVDEGAGVALAHRRLAIVDLSATGHQPMLSASGRYVLAYNGEIYNHLRIRSDLETIGRAPVWHGHSDTETLLAAIEAWGLEAALERGVGMFALALWDRDRHALYLARDRMGEKPLYYGWQGDTFLFGSELKALRAHPAFSGCVDRGSVALLLRHNCVPGPYSIYQGVSKLPPGTWLRVSASQRDAEPVSFWSLSSTAERGVAKPFPGSERDAVDTLDRLLGDAITGQMMADVPLGALLSGGIDSTLVTALMQSRSMQPVRTFTIGFGEAAYDEAAHARSVARHLGTDHTELRLTGADALALVPRLPETYDEPFADSSQLPTYLVMQLARNYVSVALSGDGGDESFGGYNRYFLGPALWRTVGWMPMRVRNALLGLASMFPAPLTSRIGISRAHDKLRKLSRVFAGRGIRNLDDLYCGLVSEWPDTAAVALGPGPSLVLLDQRERWPRLSVPAERMMAMDSLTYLPDDILVKVDRAAMAVSLETRAPFLDHRVIEFAWSLPLDMKLRDYQGKWILRKLLDRHVPRELMDRPKMGFGIPLDDWLRGPLRDWAEALLEEGRLRREGYLDPDSVRTAWRLHLERKASVGSQLWSVLMFQAWLENVEGNG